MEKINQETGEFIECEVVEENLPVDINIEPTVTFKDIKIDFNYEELKDIMSQGLKDYAIKVTYDNKKDASQMATKLNQLAGTIKRARIDNKKDMLIPITEFETKMNDLENTAQQGREFLLNQISVFDDELKSIAMDLLEKLLQDKYEEKEIEEEFQTLDIKDLAIVSNVTDNMNLAKKAKDTVESRVNLQLQAQTNKKMRLMMLENECLKAGLKVLLTENDVSHFILESDLKYNEQLASLINRELDKQKQIELNIEQERIKKEELEKQQKELEQRRAEKEEAENLEKQKQEEIKQQEEKKVIEEETGLKTITLQATFKMEVKTSISDEQISKQFERKLKEVSETFQSLEVVR